MAREPPESEEGPQISFDSHLTQVRGKTTRGKVMELGRGLMGTGDYYNTQHLFWFYTLQSISHN